MIARATKVIATETQNRAEFAYAFYDRGLAYKLILASLKTCSNNGLYIAIKIYRFK
ncbi:MAG: hypothetical protein Pg6C_02130 [Treponemataceae bacterium]|nr:MAG: hypothetical protein Pg6C_02130 [Treponemataceae bacterium]